MSNFAFLDVHDELLVRLAETAEHCFIHDPNTTLIKMRQLGEALAQSIAARVGVACGQEVRQIDLLRELDFTLRLEQRVKDAFHTLRKLGNEASHDITSSNHRDALRALQVGYALSIWFHRSFGGDKAKHFKPGAFTKPHDPSETVRRLEQQLQTLQRQQKTAEQRLEVTEQLKQLETKKAEAEKQRAQEMSEERQIWEALATEHEERLAALQLQMQQNNVQLKTHFEQQNQQQQSAEIQRLEKSLLDLSEAETRILIDEQLEAAGWIVDSENLTYGKGARPVAHENCAIAEWPTASGPADYVLFMGLTPVAVIEAKKKAKNVYGAIDQAKRYARGLSTKNACTVETQWGDYKVPLTFATNGRPYLKQREQESGIWFLDVRDSSHRRRALQGWYSPQEIKQYLRQTPQQSEDKLAAMGFDYDLKLRDYQIAAIGAVEQAIRDDKACALVAMATGTGKTKTAIALAYRLLKSERFRRILFLVDRAALGEQTTTDFDEINVP